MLDYRHATRASQGARSYQEDACAVWPGPSPLAPRGALPPEMALVAVLADGMGGHAAGDVASNIICGIFLQQFGVSAGGAAQMKLAASLAAANAAIGAKVAANPGLSGMGATCVGIAFSAVGLEWISVGDSPLYIYRGGNILRLNADHSLSPMIDQLVAEGKLTADEGEHDPRRHYLRSAVTGEDLELVDVSDLALPLESGDVVLLASDGLLTLEDDDIRRLIGAYRADGAEAIADALIRTVDGAGAVHQDNTTVVVVLVA